MPQTRRSQQKKKINTLSDLQNVNDVSDKNRAIETPELSDDDVIPTHRKQNSSDGSLSGLDSGSDSQGCHCYCIKSPKIYSAKTNADGCQYYEANDRLYHHHEAPPVLQYNLYIRTGYRAGLDYTGCLKSIFQYHNETGNIYTHLLPLVFIVYGLLAGVLQPWETARIAYTLNIASMMIMLTLSVAYHCFSANHHTYHFWLHIDVCGILLVLVGGTHFSMWWGMHCSPLLRALIMGSYYAVWTWAVLAVLRANSPKARAAPLMLLLLIRAGSLAARAFVIGGPHIALEHYLIAELCTLCGGLINAMRLPERWFQPEKQHEAGVFDFWCNSHQLMHIAVVIGMWQQYMGAHDDFEYFELSQNGQSMCPA